MLKGGELAALSRILGDGRGWSGIERALSLGQVAARRCALPASGRTPTAPAQWAAFGLLGLLTVGVFAASLSGGNGLITPERAWNDGNDGNSAASAPFAALEPEADYPYFARVQPIYPAWLGLEIESAESTERTTIAPKLSFSIGAIAQLPSIELPSSVDIARTVEAWLANGEKDDGFLITAFADAVRQSAAPRDLVTVYDVGEDGGPHVRLDSAEALALYFERMDFDLDEIRSGGELVPRRYIASLPPDLNELDSPLDRKQLFIKAVLPVVLKVNEEIMADREQLLALRRGLKAGGALSFAESVWLNEQFVRYDVGDDDIDELVRRMDIIPPSLAIAQAAEESGWGTSRFAREGNALFGQYTSAEGRGIAPLTQISAVRYRIQSYDSLVETVRSYALNLNLHPAYKEFRSLRADQRRKAEPLDGYALAGELKRYSERGKAYIKTIRIIIRENALRHFDDVRLHEPVISYGEFFEVDDLLPSS